MVFIGAFLFFFAPGTFSFILRKRAAQTSLRTFLFVFYKKRKASRSRTRSRSKIQNSFCHLTEYKTVYLLRLGNLSWDFHPSTLISAHCYIVTLTFQKRKLPDLYSGLSQNVPLGLAVNTL